MRFGTVYVIGDFPFCLYYTKGPPQKQSAKATKNSCLNCTKRRFIFNFLLCQRCVPHGQSARAAHFPLFRLFSVFEHQIIHADRVAVLNAHLLHAPENAVFAQDAVEKHAAFIVGEIDGRDQALQPGALDEPHIVELLDREITRGVDLRLGRDVIRLVACDRRQLAQEPGALGDQLARSRVRGRAQFKERAAQLLRMRAEALEIIGALLRAARR